MIANLIELIYNLAILVALSVISGFIRERRGQTWGAVQQGVLFGAAAVIGMMRPLIWGPGIIFDGRSVMLSLCGLLFGPVAAGIAGGMALLYRIFLGGGGVYMGVFVILSSSLLGWAFHERWVRKEVPLTALRLLGFGGLVHAAMVLLMFTLPAGLGLAAVQRVGLPVLLAYPWVTLLIGKLLFTQKAGLEAVMALRKNEQRLNDILNSVDAYIFIKDAQYRYTYANRRVAGLFGLPAEAIVGKSDETFFSGASLEELRRSDQPVIEHGETTAREETNVSTLDGQQRTFWAVKVPLKDEHGTVYGLCGTATDITERKRVENALQDSERMLKEAQLIAGLGSYVLDFRTGVWTSSAVLDGIFGLEAGQAYSVEAWTLLIHPDWREAMATYFAEEVVARKGSFNKEYQVIRQSDGAERWVHGLGELELDAEGQPRRMLGAIMDITERKAVQEALLHSEKKFRALFENLAEGVALHELVKDASGHPVDYRILDVNPAYQLHTGLEAATAFGRLGSELYGAQPPPYLTEYTQVAWGGEPFSFETYFPPMAKHFRISVISPKHGQFATVFEDITERKRREEELNQKNSEMERFTYMVSHDLKSPLVTIRTFLGYLEQDMAQSNAERVAKDMGFIRTATGKMTRLLEDLLEVSRVGRVVNPPVRVSLADLIQEALGAVAGAIATQGVTIQVDAPPCLLYGDRTRLEEIWQNLVENAVKYTGDQPSPRIELGVEGAGPEAVFYVRDNGLGIDPRFHDKVFGLFEQLNPTTEGTGLGLALVKRIVELYEGRIWLESEGPGLGTCFRFTLPLAMKTSYSSLPPNVAKPEPSLAKTMHKPEALEPRSDNGNSFSL